MRGIALLLTASLLLTGCAKATSDTCPRWVAYSPAEQEAAAAELDLLPAGSAVARMIADYGVVRQEIRVCRGD